MLIPAILQLWYWRRFARSLVLDVGLIVLYAVPLGMRLAIVDDFKFAWVPLWTAILYLIAARRMRAVRRDS